MNYYAGSDLLHYFNIHITIIIRVKVTKDLLIPIRLIA